MREKMADYCQLLSKEEMRFFESIYAHLTGLGYRPRKEKKQSVSYNFVHKVNKKSIVKFSSESGDPYLKLKFFASSDYSEYFNRALKQAIEKFDFKYTGCYGCGRCTGSPEGYTIKYNDGRIYFHCGFELIEFIDLNENMTGEINDLITQQHEFYIKNK